MSAEGWLDRGAVRLHYVEFGDAPGSRRPPLFLLHGLSSNALYWSRLASRITDRRVVAMDQRSHGPSSRPPTGQGAYALEEMTGDAAAMVERLGLEKPVILGHSWGATVALDMAATRSDLVSGLGFIDGPAAPMSERLSWDDAARMLQPPLPRFAVRSEAAQHIKPWIKEAWSDDLQAYAEAGAMEDGSEWVLTLTAPVRGEILRELFDFQPQLRWAALAMPALMAVAEADQGMIAWKRQGVELVQDLAPQTAVRWYASAHDIPLIRPDELAQDVKRLCLRAAWNDLAAELAAIDGDWERRAAGSDGWAARDILAHLSSTLASLPALVSRPPGTGGAASGGSSQPFDPDRWNSSQLRRRQDRTPAELREEAQKATEMLDAALIGEDLSRVADIGPYAGLPLGEVMEEMVQHQRGHMAELRASLG